jgi:hypothetical protein
MGTLLLLAWLIGGPASQASPTAPVSIDRVVARVNDDIIQSLEVRRARILKLLGPDVTTDDQVLARLIDRRLELADVARYQASEPAQADIAARREHWLADLGRPPATDLTALLRDAGMPEAALTEWFRDDVRLEAVETQRFSSARATRDEVLTYVREHAGSFPQTDGRVDVDDPAVQTRARLEIGAAKRAQAVATWVDSLRRRAQITVIR